MKLIGITGPAGSGKDTVSELLVASYDYTHISGGDTLREMLRSLGLDPVKNAVTGFAQFLRSSYSSAVVVERALNTTRSDNVVYSGFRSPGEAKTIQAHGGIIIYMDANFELRHQRIMDRARPGEDTSAEAVRSREQFEHNGTNDNEENLPKIRSMADYVILNDASLDGLKQKVIKLMESIDIL